jgi:hypothetical protein
MSKDPLERLELLQKPLIELALEEEWCYKYAKFAVDGSQSLLIHSLNTYSVTRVLGEHLFDLDSDDMLVACLGAFLHDYQKSDDEWQSAAISFMSGNRAIENDVFDHDNGSPEQLERLGKFLNRIKDDLSAFGYEVSVDTLAKRILNIVVYTHDTDNHAVAMRRRSEVGPIDPLASVIRLADSIASIKEPSEIVRKINDLDLPQGKKVVFDYHEISMIRGLTTSFLNEAIIELMSEHGYVPLLYFGNGVTYISTRTRKESNGAKKRLEELIDCQVNRFKDSDIYKRGMTNAVIGPLTQTKWPCIQLVSEEDTPNIIRYLASMPAMNKDSDYGSSVASRAKKNQAKNIDRFVALTGSEQNSILALMTSDFNLFVYVADFLKLYRGFSASADKEENFVSKINKLLIEENIGPSLDEISDVAHTTPLDRRLEVVEKLWKIKNEDLHLKKDRREILVNQFIKILRRVIAEFGDLTPPLFNQEAKDLLLADIKYAPLRLLNNEELVQLAESPNQRYINGKDQRHRICSFCGARGVENAPATLFGDGSQKFSNFIPGGSKIGGGRKAQVCALCLVESTLRAFFFPSAPATTMVVIPDLSLSPPVSKEWAEGVESFIRSERVGLSPGSTWNMLRVYKALARNETINNAQTLASMLRPTNKSVKDLAKYLKSTWGDPEIISYEVLTHEPEKCTFEDIARAYLRGDISLHKAYLEDYQTPQISQGTAYMTPGHMFFFFKYPLHLDKDESTSTVSIRAYLLALIISKVFQARVVVVDGFQPVLDLSMKGVVRIQVPAPAAVALATLGVLGETHLHEIRETLQKLSALVLISLGYVEGLGKDRLLRLATMNRGAILRRSELEDWSKIKNWQKRRLIELLDVLPAILEDEVRI